MTKLFSKIFYCAAIASLPMSCTDADKNADYEYAGVPFTEVRLEGGFWEPLISTVTDVTIPVAFAKCEETGRIDNFAKAAGLMKGRFEGLRFNDSDVFKIMEGASYSLAVDYDAEMDAYLDSLISLIGGAQEEDGYLYTIRTIGNPLHKAAGKERWSYIAQSHELYNVGHMYEAAVAHYYATGKRSFLDIAIKNADMLYNTFYEPRRRIAPGHQEIELALVKLYRATGDRRYLDLSRFFLDCRGDSGEEGIYRQDHLPVTEQREAVGHAVRAAYMYMGMADIGALMSDDMYVEAVDSIWNDVVGKKMYITGGIGSIIKGESFGPAYYLPNDIAYCETCAAIANCMWNYRMFCLHGDSKYIDVMERGLYNNVLDGISLDGMNFFYPNVLECNRHNIDEQIASQVAPDKFTAMRSPWFDCSCCPTNLSRFIPSVPGYMYAVSGKSVYVNLYDSGTSRIEMDGGNVIGLTSVTGYPWDGKILFNIDEAPSSKVTLKFRIPGWALGKPVPSSLYRYVDGKSGETTLTINGAPVSYKLDKGYASVTGKWRKGDKVELDFPMDVRLVATDERVEANRDKLAVERGPVVYCVEMTDNPDMNMEDMRISAGGKFAIVESGLGGGCVNIVDETSGVVMIPYFLHAERGMSRMSVFVKTE